MCEYRSTLLTVEGRGLREPDLCDDISSVLLIRRNEKLDRGVFPKANNRNVGKNCLLHALCIDGESACRLWVLLDKPGPVAPKQSSVLS